MISEVALFPAENIGIIAFLNFGAPNLARFVAQYVFEELMGLDHQFSVEEKVAQYEAKVHETRARRAAAPRVANTSPSHTLAEYTGVYRHAAYGEFHIEAGVGTELSVSRQRLRARLRHFHYEAWVAATPDMFGIHLPHAFDGVTQWRFDTNEAGAIAALMVPLEPSVAPIRFHKVDKLPSGGSPGTGH